MPRTPNVTDDEIRARLAEAGEPTTAAAIGVSAQRLRRTEGVKEVGHQQTGKRGRPAVLFALA